MAHKCGDDVDDGEDDESAFDDRDDPQDIDIDDEQERDSATNPCSSCGGPVYEDADRCPHCGEWVVAAPRKRLSLLLIAGLLLAALLLPVLLGRW